MGYRFKEEEQTTVTKFHKDILLTIWNERNSHIFKYMVKSSDSFIFHFF